MRELETRIVDIDVDDIREKLLSLGGKKVKSEDQVNEIYDFEDGRLLSAKVMQELELLQTDFQIKKLLL